MRRIIYNSCNTISERRLYLMRQGIIGGLGNKADEAADEAGDASRDA